MAQFVALELVEDIELLRGRFAAGCCALGARSSWHIIVRNRDKSSHLERVEILRNSQEILCFLLVAQLDCKKAAKAAESKSSYKFLTPLSQNRNTFCGPLYTPAVLDSPCCRHLRQKCLSVNTAPLV